MDQLEETRLIHEILKGRPDLYRALVLRWQAPLLRFLRSMLGRRPGGRELALDIGQESFLAAYSALDVFDPKRGRFGPWLMRIARNKCATALRRAAPDHCEIPDSAASDTDTERDAANRQEFRLLDQALSELTAQNRSIFLLAEVEGFAMKEIARIEGLRVGTVKSRLSRVKTAIRQRLEEFGAGQHGERE